MKLIRRCYECRHWYVPFWHGNATIRLRDDADQPIGRPIHGHPHCMIRPFGVGAPRAEKVLQLSDDALERRLRRIEQIVASTDSGDSPFGWRTGP